MEVHLQQRVRDIMDNRIEMLLGDCLKHLKDLPDNKTELVVTDPPYGIKYASTDWDKVVPAKEIWEEVYRTMVPGAFAFIMSSTRQDLMAKMITTLSDVGFETGFSCIQWVYASGMSKAKSIKAIISSINKTMAKRGKPPKENSENIIKYFDGAYAGFQPKPATETILVVMKPLKEISYVQQAIKNAKGITWLDQGRIPRQDTDDTTAPNILVSDDILEDFSRYFSLDLWFIEMMRKNTNELIDNKFPIITIPKPTVLEKDKGLEKEKVAKAVMLEYHRPTADTNPDQWEYLPTETPFGGANRSGNQKNNHPTVKPIALMSYLISIGSMEKDVVVDPFMGSGTTGIAAVLTNRKFVGYEIKEDYFRIASKRVSAWLKEKTAKKSVRDGF